MKQDTLIISDLLLRCIIGINEDERKNLQDVILNIEIYTDTKKAGKSDDIHDTVNYRTIAKEIIKMVESSSFNLLETMNAEIVKIIFSHESVEGCKVRAEKPGALRFSRNVGVEIERWKKTPKKIS